LLHVLGLVAFTAMFFMLDIFPTPLRDSFGGDLKFLTILGLSLSRVTFFIGLLADLTLNQQLFAIKNVLSICATPLEVLVSILYWGITAIDRSLVVPDEIHLPFGMDFGMHAMPAIMLTLDLLLLSPPWTVKAYHAMALSMTIAFAYWIWMEICFAKIEV